MRINLALLGTATLALAACTQTNDDATVGTDTETATTASPMADAAMSDTAVASPAAMPAAGNPQAFVDEQAASDMFEMESSKLAQQMGKSDKVKSFAAMMITDHTKSTNDLKTAAAQVQNVTVTPRLNPKQQSDLEALRSAGSNFDTLYAQQQVAGHQATLARLQAQAQSGEAAPLKAFAAKTAPVVEAHLAEARQLP